MERRTYIRAIYENVDGHARVAVSHPMFLAVTETREDEDAPWQQEDLMNISGCVQDSRLEAEPGGLLRLWLKVIKFDVDGEQTS